jgi:hypothetical protein
MARKQGPDGNFVDTRTGRADRVAYPAPAVIQTSEPFEWGDVPGDVLADAIGAVTARGHAISFAVNRSHSAGCVTVLAGEDRPKWYPQSTGEAVQLLMAIRDSAK